MWNKLWTKLLGTQSNPLSEILETPFNREGFLGVRQDRLPTPEQMIADNDKAIVYARTEDYAIWANEAWAQVLDCVDELTKPETEPTKADFVRGKLAGHIDDLRISYRAIKNKQEAIESSKRHT